MKIADTSALYAFLAPCDAHHKEALQIMESAEPIIVPAEIWSETIALIQYRNGPEPAREAVRRLHAIGHLEIQPTPDDPWNDIAQKATKVHADHPELSYPDAIVAAWCLARNHAAFTFDQHILEAVGP